MIDEPGSFSGSEISPRPERGPEPISRMSLAILNRPLASAPSDRQRHHRVDGRQPGPPRAQRLQAGDRQRGAATFSGSEISPRPERGPEPISRMSLAILNRPLASALSASGIRREVRRQGGGADRAVLHLGREQVRGAGDPRCRPAPAPARPAGSLRRGRHRAPPARRSRRIPGPGLSFTSAENKFEALATHDALVFTQGALNALASALGSTPSSAPRPGSG
jgi:hypothetical protein